MPADARREFVPMGRLTHEEFGLKTTLFAPRRLLASVFGRGACGGAHQRKAPMLVAHSTGPPQPHPIRAHLLAAGLMAYLGSPWAVVRIDCWAAGRKATQSMRTASHPMPGTRSCGGRKTRALGNPGDIPTGRAYYCRLKGNDARKASGRCKEGTKSSASHL